MLGEFDIPKQDVAERLVVNTNPPVEVDGVPLRLQFWKVLVQEARSRSNQQGYSPLHFQKIIKFILNF